MKPICNMTRVNETAGFIAAELRALLDRTDHRSFLNKRLDEGCAAYHRGLTNNERLLATLLALSSIQIEVAGDLGSLTYGYGEGEGGDDDDDGDDDRIGSNGTAHAILKFIRPPEPEA